MSKAAVQQLDNGDYLVTGTGMINLLDAPLGYTRTHTRRLIEQGGIQVAGRVVKDHMVPFEWGDIIQIGKRQFIRFVK